MSENKKESKLKKIGKTALRETSKSVKGAVIGSVGSSVTKFGKDKLKKANKDSGLSDKVDKTIKNKEKEVKKKILKEGFKQALKK